MTLRPRRSKRQIVCADFFKKSERIYFAAPPSQITTAALGCDLGSPLCGVFRFCRNIGFNRYLHKNNQTFRCGYFYEYREDFTYPAEVNSACGKVLLRKTLVRRIHAARPCRAEGLPDPFLTAFPALSEPAPYREGPTG